MFDFIPIIAAVLAGAVVLTLTSDTFAGGVSRVVEAGFDALEYRLALRARSRREGEPRRERRFEGGASLSHAG